MCIPMICEKIIKWIKSGPWNYYIRILRIWSLIVFIWESMKDHAVHAGRRNLIENLQKGFPVLCKTTSHNCTVLSRHIFLICHMCCSWHCLKCIVVVCTIFQALTFWNIRINIGSGSIYTFPIRLCFQLETNFFTPLSQRFDVIFHIHITGCLFKIFDKQRILLGIICGKTVIFLHLSAALRIIVHAAEQKRKVFIHGISTHFLEFFLHLRRPEKGMDQFQGILKDFRIIFFDIGTDLLIRKELRIPILCQRIYADGTQMVNAIRLRIRGDHSFGVCISNLTGSSLPESEQQIFSVIWCRPCNSCIFRIHIHNRICNIFQRIQIQLVIAGSHLWSSEKALFLLCHVFWTVYFCNCNCHQLFFCNGFFFWWIWFWNSAFISFSGF